MTLQDVLHRYQSYLHMELVYMCKEVLLSSTCTLFFSLTNDCEKLIFTYCFVSQPMIWFPIGLERNLRILLAWLDFDKLSLSHTKGIHII